MDNHRASNPFGLKCGCTKISLVRCRYPELNRNSENYFAGSERLLSPDVILMVSVRLPTSRRLFILYTDAVCLEHAEQIRQQTSLSFHAYRGRCVCVQTRVITVSPKEANRTVTSEWRFSITERTATKAYREVYNHNERNMTWRFIIANRANLFDWCRFEEQQLLVRNEARAKYGDSKLFIKQRHA